jgi:hypothetical protein
VQAAKLRRPSPNAANSERIPRLSALEGISRVGGSHGMLSFPIHVHFEHLSRKGFHGM